MDHDGTIVASYPLNNITVFETISKDHYCIDSYNSSVLFCVPEPEDVCPEIVSSQVMSVRFSYETIDLGLHHGDIPGVHGRVRLVLPPDPRVILTPRGSAHTY